MAKELSQTTSDIIRDQEAYPELLARAQRMFELITTNETVRKTLAALDPLGRDCAIIELAEERRHDRPVGTFYRPTWNVNDQGNEKVYMEIDRTKGKETDDKTRSKWSIVGLRQLRLAKAGMNQMGYRTLEEVTEVVKEWFGDYDVTVTTADENNFSYPWTCRLTRKIDAQALAAGHPSVIDNLGYHVDEIMRIINSPKIQSST